MAESEKLRPEGPTGRRETERDSYGGSRRWATGAGETWTSPMHSGSDHRGPRETDPESARWRGSEHANDDQGGVLRKVTDTLGITRRGPKGYTRSDERIREDVCERLWHAHEVDAGDVSVHVASGVVTLEGHVPERRMKHTIEDLAASSRGVHDVENRIRVASPATGAPSSGT
jgi:hypothetical protein